MSQSRNLRINRDATFATRRGSGAGFVGAVLIHITIIAATLFSFAHKLDIVDESTPVVPVDLVTIGTKNDIAPTVTKKLPEPADQQVQAQPQPEPPKPELQPEPQPSPVVAPPTPPKPVAREPEAEQPDDVPSEPVVKPAQPTLSSLPKPR